MAVGAARQEELQAGGTGESCWLATIVLVADPGARALDADRAGVHVLLGRARRLRPEVFAEGLDL